MTEQPRILRPRPRRPFEITPASTESSGPPTPAESTGTEHLNPNADAMSNSTSVSRTGSVMNLTASTLYGIYSPTAFDGFRDESSPWGTEANSPAAEFPPEPLQRAAEKSAIEPRRMVLRRTRSRLSHGLFRGVILPQALSSMLLFGFGVAYGVITIHLHDNHWITPVKLENIHYYDSGLYLGFWGLAGMALGNLLPWLDGWREDKLEQSDPKLANTDEENEERTPSWVAVARSVGAFVGIAFAMRKLPWESTTQASLTLALANPVLWYLIDRTTTGFVLSTTVGLTGMAAVLGLKPELVPASTGPSFGTSLLNGTGLENVLGAGITQESIAVGTWIASVIFCACVCFGNVGRQLSIGAGVRDVMKP
ncbi:Insulin-induced protein family [Penicillium fimorum]|uniref:Insulin-induced protein family n=1 Tax=Penicillium fimorum TaxID=1882269 RepID=A0A9W9XTI4_9EURO|nr:Insulin-induced protein family [Penicillium fimorum]